LGDWLDMEEDDSVKAEIVHAPSSTAIARDNTSRLRLEVEERSLAVAAAVSRFGDLDPADPESVEAFKHKHGNEVYRLAMSAWLPNKDAPIGLKLNMDLATSLIKAAASKAPDQRPLNILVMINAGPVQLEEMEVGDGSK